MHLRCLSDHYCNRAVMAFEQGNLIEVRDTSTQPHTHTTEPHQEPVVKPSPVTDAIASPIKGETRHERDRIRGTEGVHLKANV